MRNVLLASTLPLIIATFATSCGDDGPTIEGCDVTVQPGGEIQAAFDDALTGTTICLAAGIHQPTEVLSISTGGITLKGAGDVTILDFANQSGAPKSIDVTGDDFTAQDFQIKNSPGDGIVVTGATNVTFRNLRVSWDGGPSTDNGAYAIYPVNCTNVIIEDCEVTDASDAGVYVGQSNHIIVRRNVVHRNVAGIEIENSQDAEVYENDSFDNTAGVLVFDLPNLPVKDGRRTNVHHNNIHDNNRENFAPPGNIVAKVPAGIGIVIMSADETQVHDNTITGNISTGVAIASYASLPLPAHNDPLYDAYPQTLYIYDNTYMNNGTDPQDLLLLPMVTPLEDVLWDGYFDPTLPETNGDICIQEPNGTFRNIDGDDFMQQSTDVTPHLCTHPELPPVMF